MLDNLPEAIWVFDCSSILEIRRLPGVSHHIADNIYSKLGLLVEAGQIFFPKEVVDELERFSNPRPAQPDLPLAWAKKYQVRACRHPSLFDDLPVVLQVAGAVLDPDKTGVEEADPYVLALARVLERQSSSPVWVVTEERRDRSSKISLTTACGLLRLHCLPVRQVLRLNNIFPELLGP